ncbi:DUF3592 domain-containing protein [Plantactinospora sp. BB1]|uniref:DUF3592 domain-containing protein n=1 Tax=Plantactinospora sp. BB1 TaxID=2071627 RepID=UPI000D16D331|nr:DUF3592 domain-containing protein [Plantactinospora sp. BB1]AVT39176.1 hypothetical protein C6W10_25110 [Plantactinospora sp. BB1]
MALFGTVRRPPAKLFVAMGVVVVCGFAVATWQVWTNDNALRDRGRQVTARVTGVDLGKKSRVEVEFRTSDGRQVRSLVGQGDEAPGPRVQVGDEIPIVYDPRHPDHDVRDARAPENHRIAYMLLGTTLFGLVGVPLATLRLLREERRKGTG